MKYCLHYFRNSKIIEKVDEIMIRVKPHHTSAAMLHFIEKYPNSRIILDILDLNEEDFDNIYEGIAAAGSEGMNVSIMIDSTQHFEDRIRDAGVTFFYADRANTFEKVVSFINRGASDVYITDELGFNLLKIGTYCHSRNVKVRAFPNVAQSSSPFGAESTPFFIRPEGEFIYNNSVDVYEFWGPISKQDVFYRIYTSHQWLGNLGYIIYDLGMNVSSDRLLPYFDHTRLKCEKRCLEGRCDACSAMNRFATALEENGDFRIKVQYPDDYSPEIEQELLAPSLPDENIEQDFNIED